LELTLRTAESGGFLGTKTSPALSLTGMVFHLQGTHTRTIGIVIFRNILVYIHIISSPLSTSITEITEITVKVFHI